MAGLCGCGGDGFEELGGEDCAPEDGVGHGDDGEENGLRVSVSGGCI